MKYKKLWTDMHSNIHHDQMEALPLWYEQIKKEMDFWPIAYYPFYMRPTSSGLAVEDRYEDELIEKDWEQVRQLALQAEKKDFLCLWVMNGRERGWTATTMYFSWKMEKSKSILCVIRSW